MKKSLLAISLASLLAATSMADARDLRLAPGAPSVHPAHTPLYASLAEFLPGETGGALTGTILGTEVANVPNMKASLQSSVAEVGNVLPLYYSADLPNTALMGDLAFLGTDPHAMGAAMTEYVTSCEGCLADFKKMGGVYAGSGSSDVYVMLTTKPIRSADDMKGMRLRSGGSPFSRFAEYAGATPVSVGSNAQFESLSQGVIDGTMASVNDLVSYRLVDLVKYVTELPLGTYHATSNFTVASATWASLSVEERKGFIRAANRANPMFTQAWGYDRPGGAKEQGVAAGVEFITPDQSLIDLKDAFVAQDMAAIEKIGADQYGVADPAAEIARFRDLVAKWTKISADVGGDQVKIAEAMQTEIWDKIDYNTYGL